MTPNDRAVTRFAMLGHGLFHVYELSIPVFVVAWLDAFDASTAVMGGVVGVGYALVGLGAVPAGLLSDRLPSRALVLASVGGMGGGFLLVAAAPNPWVIGAALAVWGAAASLYHPAGLALLSRATVDRGEAFAAHGAAGNAGTAAGPLLAAVGLSLFDWRAVVAAFVVPAAAVVVASLRLRFDETAGADERTAAPDEAREERDGDGAGPDGGGPAGGTGDPRSGPAEPDGGPRRTGSGARARVADAVAEARTFLSGGFGVVLVVVVLYGLYYRGVLTFLPDLLGALPAFAPVAVAGATVEPAQYAYAGLLVVGIGGQYLGGRLTDEYEPAGLLVAAFALLTAVSLAFVPAAAAGPAPLIGVCVVLAFAVYFVAPVYQAAIADRVAPERRGLSYGVTYLGMFGVGALGAALAGWLIAVGGRGRLFGVLAALVALAGAVAAALRGR